MAPGTSSQLVVVWKIIESAFFVWRDSLDETRQTSVLKQEQSDHTFFPRIQHCLQQRPEMDSSLLNTRREKLALPPCAAAAGQDATYIGPLWTSEVGAVEPCPAIKNQSGDADTSLHCCDRRRLCLGFDIGKWSGGGISVAIAVGWELQETKQRVQFAIVK